jgi:hypothetical protein
MQRLRSSNELKRFCARTAITGPPSFEPPQGMARIFVYRTDEYAAPDSAGPPGVGIDGHVVGHADGESYVVVDVTPGPHRVSAATAGILGIDAVADSTYCVHLSWKNSMFQLHLVPLSKARNEIASVRRVVVAP